MAREPVPSGMSVSEAVQSRKSIRQFTDEPVDPAVIRRVLETAARSASGGNLQPWHIHVVGGEPLCELKAVMRRVLAERPGSEVSQYHIYPPNLVSPYRERRFEVGEELYRSIGIPREDKPRRLAQLARNYEFFGAPLALFCSLDRRMGQPQWSDCGMFLQTVMLLLREAGLDSCAQECWSQYPQTIGKFLALPPEWMLFCGMAIGHADTSAPINQWHAPRVPLDEFAKFMGV